MIPPSSRRDQARVLVEQFVWSPWVKGPMVDSGGVEGWPSFWYVPLTKTEERRRKKGSANKEKKEEKPYENPYPHEKSKKWGGKQRNEKQNIRNARK